jgi:D-3-phosphoglycerate dehydrogenase
MKVLITTTSFQDTPGAHHDLLKNTGWQIQTARGPLPEAEMLKLVGDFDGIICGDDAFTKPVLQKCLPRLKVLSKYGIGIDKIDLKAATELGIPVCFTPGVNHTAVAEHVFGLLLALTRNIITEHAFVTAANWKRVTGTEIWQKTMGVLGLGRIGKEVVKRAKGFEMEVLGYDLYWDEAFARQYGVKRAASADEVAESCDVLSLNMNLTADNKQWLNAARIARMRKGAYVINCARGGLVDEKAVAEALKSGQLAGYGADVFEPEPIVKDHPLLAKDIPPGKIAFTPHIASRTYESVVRQASMACENLMLALQGKKPIAQANPEVPLRK